MFLSVTHTSRRDWGRRVTLYLFFQCLSSSFFFPFLFVLSFFFSVFGIASLRHSLLPRGHTCAEERHFDSCLFCSVPCRFSYFYFLFLLFLLHRRLLSKSLLLDLFSCLSLSLSLSWNVRVHLPSAGNSPRNLQSAEFIESARNVRGESRWRLCIA